MADNRQAGGKRPTGARLERSLRERGFQTDKLTLSIARNLQALERFAERYNMGGLLTGRARSTFAAMSTDECAHFLEFLQLSIHVGRDSSRTRQRWLGHLQSEQTLAYLAAVADKPQLIEGRARAIFQAMSPRAQRLAAMMLLAAWEAAQRSAGLQDRQVMADVVDRMVGQLEGDATRA